MDNSPAVGDGDTIPAFSKQSSSEEDPSPFCAAPIPTDFSIAPMTARLDHLSLSPRPDTPPDADAQLSRFKVGGVDAPAHFDDTAPSSRTNLNSYSQGDGPSPMASSTPTKRAKGSVMAARFPILAPTAAVQGENSKVGRDVIGRKGSYASLQSNVSSDEPPTPG
jgi:hypothetical protein